MISIIGPESQTDVSFEVLNEIQNGFQQCYLLIIFLIMTCSI